MFVKKSTYRKKKTLAENFEKEKNETEALVENLYSIVKNLDNVHLVNNLSELTEKIRILEEKSSTIDKLARDYMQIQKMKQSLVKSFQNDSYSMKSLEKKANFLICEEEFKEKIFKFLETCR